MDLSVERVDVWAATLEDRSGSLAAKLTALAEAGANLDFVVSRRTPETPGAGVVFVAPLRGDEQIEAAGELGFSAAASLHSVRVKGPNRPGIAASLASALAEEEINLRGISGAVLGDQFIVYLALDTAEDAVKAMNVLRAVRVA